MNTLSHIPAYVWRLLFAAALVAVALLTQAVAADCECVDYLATAQPESWIFARSRYSHDPDTGARVAQYSQVAPVEPLPDPRDVTSGYSRTRTVLRGADGSTDTYYRVRNYGNGRGGLDAEWERFHDAWRGSRVAGGSYQGIPPYGYPGYGYGYGGFPGYFPGYGGPGFGGPGYGGPGYGGTPGGGPGVAPLPGYGPGYGRPDAGYLDPDATDGYRDPRPRTPDSEFFNRGFAPPVEHHHGEEETT